MLENGMDSTILKHQVNQALPKANHLILLSQKFFHSIKKKFGFIIADLDIRHLGLLKSCFLLYLKV